jgi:hypothetical protein
MLHYRSSQILAPHLERLPSARHNWGWDRCCASSAVLTVVGLLQSALGLRLLFV